MEHGAKVLVPRASLLPSGLRSGGSRIYSGPSKGLLMSGAGGDQRDSGTWPRHAHTASLRTQGDPVTVLILQRGEGAQRSEVRQTPRGHTASSNHRGARAQPEQVFRGSFVAGKDATLH